MGLVFMSHSSKDKGLVRRFDRLFRAYGVETFLDERDIGVGDDIPQAVFAAIDRATHFCYFISRHSVASAWVKDELSSARMSELEGRGIKIVPVLIDDVVLPATIRSKKYADFRTQSLSHQPKAVADLLWAIGASYGPGGGRLGVDRIAAICGDAAFLATVLTDAVFLLHFAGEAKDATTLQRRLRNAADEIRSRQLNRRLRDLLAFASQVGLIGIARVLATDIERKADSLSETLSEVFSALDTQQFALAPRRRAEDLALYLSRRLTQLQQAVLQELLEHREDG